MAAEKKLNMVAWDVDAGHQEIHYSVSICYTPTQGDVLIGVDTDDDCPSMTEGKLPP